MTDSPDLHLEAGRRIDAVEQALRRLGRWQDEPLPPEQLQYERAFGADTMSFEQWLQFVLVPRVRELIATRGAFPATSNTAAYAVRNFDGDDQAEELIDALEEFDRVLAAAAAVPATPRAGPFANHAEQVAAVIASGAITPQELTVRGMLIAVQVGNEAAARSHLVAAQRDDESLHLKPPIEIYDFHVGRPELHAGRDGAAPFAVVQAQAAGIGPGGERVEQPLPFVLLEEQGGWKIDLHRSMGMMLNGDPHGGTAAIEQAMTGAMQSLATGMAEAMNGAMTGVAEALQGAFGGAPSADVAERRAESERTLREECVPALAELLGAPLTIDVDWAGLAATPEAPRELENLLGRDLRHALAYLFDDDRARLAEGIDRLVVRFDAQSAAQGVFREPPVLRLCAHPDGFLSFGSSNALAGWLRLQLDPDLQERANHVAGQLGQQTDALRERLQLGCRLDADWEGLANAGNPGEVAWALHRLGEHGAEAFGEALARVLERHADLAEWARANLYSLQLTLVHDPAAMAVTAPSRHELCLCLVLREDDTGHWPAERLEAEVERALRGAMAAG